jgi:hypothetical protein
VSVDLEQRFQIFINMVKNVILAPKGVFVMRKAVSHVMMMLIVRFKGSLVFARYLTKSSRGFAYAFSLTFSIQ